MIHEERMKQIRDHIEAFNALAAELKAAGYHISGWDHKTDQTAIGVGEGHDARIVGYINRDLSIEWREDLTMSEYELRFDTGEVAIIRAKTRGQAIEIYRAEHGAPADWMKAHCTVKNLGRV